MPIRYSGLHYLAIESVNAHSVEEHPVSGFGARFEEPLFDVQIAADNRSMSMAGEHVLSVDNLGGGTVRYKLLNDQPVEEGVAEKHCQTGLGHFFQPIQILNLIGPSLSVETQ